MLPFGMFATEPTTSEEGGLEVSIVRTLLVADEIRELWLAPVDGRELSGIDAGAHITVRLPSGRHRNYSLVNAPGDRSHYVIAVKRDPEGRGGSTELFQMTEGQSFTVSGPEQTFGLDATHAEHVFVAGGIGITPIWSMVQQAEADGLPWRLFYGTRSRDSAAYVAELERLEHKSPGRVRLAFADEGGRLDIASVISTLDESAGVYCCGPERIIDAFRSVSAPLGARAHLEDFTVADAAEGGFEVELAQTGTTIFVPEGQTILDAVLEAGIEPEYSCMSGTCGSCEVAVLAGIPDHRDYFLSDDEKAQNDRMMICCSGRKSGPLIIDL